MSNKQTPGLSRDETEERIKQALYYLTRIVQDMGIPRNIRRSASEAVRVLMDPNMSPGLKASTVISILDEALSDPNMPLFSRVVFLQVIAILEQIKDAV
ncbi:MAG: UPF0147 family protein [Vulcanisaeta sp.]|jgi:hypothetical protein|nr:UPF0147 family protein [Vulcanisaeta sp.]MCG2869503.1 UPF0147 family protein [Vulcanisaeta sp.]MCG2879809.1 UPF0147 family protein [Vulcanisaeta sp.]MCG2886463.1 UPF0147 family protein [Vulcanisaeta sp.]